MPLAYNHRKAVGFTVIILNFGRETVAGRYKGGGFALMAIVFLNKGFKVLCYIAFGSVGFVKENCIAAAGIIACFSVGVLCITVIAVDGIAAG